MKALFISLVALATLVLSAHADVTVNISDLHLCCPSCVKGAKKAIATVPGVTATVDADSDVASITGPDTATVQKAVDALTSAGYFGTSSDASIKVSTDTGATGAKVTTLTVSGVHLCCGKCVKAVNKALGTVPGVTGNTAAKGAKSFTVTGNFTDSDVFAALQKEGLTGKEVTQ